MKPSSALLSLMTSLTVVPYAAGLDGTWIDPNGGAWGDAGNWNGGVIATGANFLADFGGLDLTADAGVTVDVARVIGGLRLGDTDPTHDWTLSPGAAGVLQLDNSSGSPQIEVLAGSFVNMLVGLEGTQGFTKTGAGTLRLAAINLYSGPTVVNDGVLSLGGDNSLGVIPAAFTANQIVLNGGALSTVSADGTTGLRTIHANQGITLGPGGGTLSSPFGGLLVVNSAITGGVGTGLVVEGAGDVLLAGSNTFGSGVTGVSVTGSTLRLGSNGALGAGMLTLAANSTVTSDGAAARTLANDVFLATAGSVTTFGDGTGTGALEFQSLLLSSMGSPRTINTVADVTFSGQLAGSAIAGTVFTKTGAGTLSLNGPDGSPSYIGGLHVISEGTLLVNNLNGNGLGSGGSIQVEAGGRLGGNGSVSQGVSVSGTLSPGASVGSFAVDSASFLDGSVFEYEMQSGAAEPADLLRVEGALGLVGVVTLSLTGADGAWADGSKVTLMSYGSFAGGTFSGLADDSIFTAGSNQWLINYNDTAGGTNFAADQAGASGFLTLTLVPEPSVSLLGILGAAAAIGRRRRVE